jgi:hypothetical protein
MALRPRLWAGLPFRGTTRSTYLSTAKSRGEHDAKLRRQKQTVKCPEQQKCERQMEVRQQQKSLRPRLNKGGKINRIAAIRRIGCYRNIESRM